MKNQFGLYNTSFEHDACGIGFIANLHGKKSHKLIDDAIEILVNLEHRGAVSGDGKTGDGAGMLLQIPDRFFRKALPFAIPAFGEYGAGILFMPKDKAKKKNAEKIVKEAVAAEGGELLGFREVPVNPDVLGEIGLAGMPNFLQFFVTFPNRKARKGALLNEDDLEHRLYILRKVMEKSAANAGLGRDDFYIPSLSCRIMIYKGMFVAPQFSEFYPDLANGDFESALAVVHQRYSTNTLPSWSLAQPFRRIAHNGEINTLRRNVNNMQAREKILSSPLFGEEITKLRPVLQPDGSDSAAFDNVFELLSHGDGRLGGRTLEHAVMMMIPEPFGTRYHISEDRRNFYDYHAAIMEPWDGPAALIFTDGRRVGAILDRNGLRPGRYSVSEEGTVILSSEAGVIKTDESRIIEKGRLKAGRVIVADTVQGRLIRDREIKSHITRQQPYRRWLAEERIELSGLFGSPHPVKAPVSNEELRIFGYSHEDIKLIVQPMASQGQEMVGSMGNDAPPAILSEEPLLLYDYFRQLFAQVTNPPIDPYREELVMSLMSYVGRESNLLDELPTHCHQLKLPHPILSNNDMTRLKQSDIRDFKTSEIPIHFTLQNDGEEPGHGKHLETSLSEVCAKAEEKIDEGYALLILTDRGSGEGKIPIPALLAVSAVHQHLVKKKKRHLAGLLLESGEVREVHHFAALIGFGCSGINPYLAFGIIEELHGKGDLPEGLSLPKAMERYIAAVKKGLLKVMSRMGISTIRSYRGAQIFEAVGLSRELVERYFTGTLSRIGGIGLKEIEEDAVKRFSQAFPKQESLSDALPTSGLYGSRRSVEGGTERHLFSAKAVVTLQKAVRTSDFETFREYTEEVNSTDNGLSTIRNLIDFKKGTPIPIDEVESEEEIVKRFYTGAMSLGSLSPEAHETIATAMNGLSAGGSNSGEGGESPVRYTIKEDGRDLRSHVKQVASGRFGVDASYLASADEIQIKMAQGAKPGEGGQLPGHKVDEAIAKVRYTTPGVMLISPPPHHDIYSIEDLSQLIYDLKKSNPSARISVKLVAEPGVGTVAAGVAKGKADMVLISGSDGGTGASPLSSIRHVGSYWEIGLAETHQTLIRNDLRNKIRVQTDGQLKTGRDVVIAALLGADEFGFGTTALVSIGCVMMRKCHTNGCPVGVATQKEELRKRFPGKPEHLMNFMRFIAREVREIMAELGFRNFSDMVGRSDCLMRNPGIKKTESNQWAAEKCRNITLSALLEKPSTEFSSSSESMQNEGDKSHLDEVLIPLCKEAIEKRKPVKITQEIRNYNRTTGTTLSYHIAKKYGREGLTTNGKGSVIAIDFKGSAGQSFGAFLSAGVTFDLEGEANDYLGKGLSGGRIVVRPPQESRFLAHRNVISGNVNLFGATAGEAFICGVAGERFAVRNSGALSVVEGVGDHGCEYMTGGKVIVLGGTGVNFAAGMSGGVAYVFDESQLFDTRCNLEMVDVEPVLQQEERDFLKETIERHVKYTGSERGKWILGNWEENLHLFVRVMPLEYRKALERLKEREREMGAENLSVTEEIFD